MKKWVVVFLFFAAVAGGYWYLNSFNLKEPVFIGIRNLRILTIEDFNAQAAGEALFKNPNMRGADLLNTELKISSNGVLVAGISQSERIQIQGESEFNVPFTFKVDLVKLGLSQSLSGVLSQVLSRERQIHLQFEGYCRIRTGSIIRKIPVKYEETVTIR